MGVVAVANGSQEIAALNSEYSLAQQTGIGIYVLAVDVSALEAGDTLKVYIKTRLANGASSRIAYEMIYADAQVEPNQYSVPVPIDTEIVCTMEQTAGTVRTIPWTLLRA